MGCSLLAIAMPNRGCPVYWEAIASQIREMLFVLMALERKSQTVFAVDYGRHS